MLAVKSIFDVSRHEKVEATVCCDPYVFYSRPCRVPSMVVCTVVWQTIGVFPGGVGVLDVLTHRSSAGGSLYHPHMVTKDFDGHLVK